MLKIVNKPQLLIVITVNNFLLGKTLLSIDSVYNKFVKYNLKKSCRHHDSNSCLLSSISLLMLRNVCNQSSYKLSLKDQNLLIAYQLSVLNWKQNEHFRMDATFVYILQKITLIICVFFDYYRISFQNSVLSGKCYCHLSFVFPPNCHCWLLGNKMHEVGVVNNIITFLRNFVTANKYVATLKGVDTQTARWSHMPNSSWRKESRLKW